VPRADVGSPRPGTDGLGQEDPGAVDRGRTRGKASPHVVTSGRRGPGHGDRWADPGGSTVPHVGVSAGNTAHPGMAGTAATS